MLICVGRIGFTEGDVESGDERGMTCCNVKRFWDVKCAVTRCDRESLCRLLASGGHREQLSLLTEHTPDLNIKQNPFIIIIYQRELSIE